MVSELSNPRQKQRLELIGTVASGVAHDLNNQLTVLLNNLDFALAGLENTHAVRSNLVDVQRAALRCSEMTHALLRFGGRTAERFSPMDLAPVVTETARLLRRVIPAAIEIDIHVEAGMPAVLADQTQIQQVLINLSVNARDAMPKGGSLTIRAERDEAMVVLLVSDTGAGMEASVRERIFDPFFTTKGDGAGTGLGLSMVAAIVKDHSGSIAVESQPGLGSTFRVALPLAAAALKEGATEGARQAPPPRRAGCVLVADDDDLVRGVAAESLRRIGYHVIEARDGDEAVHLYSAHAHQIDLLFFDVSMPRATGTEAVTRVRLLNPRVKALLTSGYTDLLATGEFLRKPYTSGDLAGKVNEMMTVKQ